MLVDWAPEDVAPRHFSFFGRREDRGAARQSLFDAEAAAASREELNLLYVAVTRARQVLIASGIENARARDATPYRWLEAALAKLGDGAAHGDALPSVAVERSPAASGGEAIMVPMPAIGERREASGDAERFGVLLHALLERRTEGRVEEGWWKALGFDDAEYRRVLPVAERLLAAPALRRFFDPARYRRAWNEIDITDGQGALRRIDRLVELDDAFWVLDYKSSASDTPRVEDYREQVRAYCRAVGEAFDGRRVRGGLIFADGVLMEVGECG